MATLWDSIKKGAQIAAEKAEELGKKSKIMIEISTIKHKIENKFTQLGGRIYHLVQEEGTTMMESDEEVSKLVKSIRTLETKLNEKQEELKQINETLDSEETEY